MQKRITKLCRAGLLALVTWVVALHVTAAGEPLHMLVLLVRCSHRAEATPFPPLADRTLIPAPRPAAGTSVVPRGLWQLPPGAADSWRTEFPDLPRRRESAAAGGLGTVKHARRLQCSAVHLTHPHVCFHTGHLQSQGRAEGQGLPLPDWMKQTS